MVPQILFNSYLHLYTFIQSGFTLACYSCRPRNPDGSVDFNVMRLIHSTASSRIIHLNYVWDREILFRQPFWGRRHALKRHRNVVKTLSADLYFCTLAIPKFNSKYYSWKLLKPSPVGLVLRCFKFIKIVSWFKYDFWWRRHHLSKNCKEQRKQSNFIHLWCCTAQNIKSFECCTV